MRLLILSDLHLDAHRAAARARGTDADPWPYPRLPAVGAVVCAGDAADGPDGLHEVAARCAGVPVIAVAGNHEYYTTPGAADTAAVQQRLRQPATGGALHWLENAAVVLGGVRFLGATLWTDFALYGAAAAGMAASARVMPDFRGAIRHDDRRLTPADTVRWHRASVEWLATELARPFPGPTVVVTHHAPHPACIEPAYAGDPVSAAFASDLGALLDGRAALWIHGHCHRATHFTVGGTRVISNPRGYPDEGAQRTGFEAGCVIDVAGSTSGPR